MLTPRIITRQWLVFGACLVTVIGSVPSAAINRAAPSQSLALRWVYDGDLPAEVMDWLNAPQFGANPKAPPVGRRADLYLIAEGSDNIGFRLPAGNLRLKLRRGTTNIEFPDGRVSGMPEIWDGLEWDYHQCPADPVFSGFLDSPHGARAPVWEEASQRKLRMNGTHRQPVPTGAWVHRGCAAEITLLTPEQRKAWTVAVETLESPAPELMQACAG